MFQQSPQAGRKRSKLRIVALIGGLILSHWIYLTWDNVGQGSRLRIATERPVYFTWVRGVGFPEFRVDAYPGDWFGSRWLRALIAVQLKPQVTRYLEPSDMNQATGYTGIRIFNFAPLLASAELGTDASWVEDPTITPLMKAAREGNLRRVQEIIGEGADVNRTDQSGRSALAHALADPPSAVEMMGILARAGAKLDIQDHDGFTPLMRAARDGNASAVRALIALGANIAISNRKGETARQVAERDGYKDIVAILDAQAPKAR